MSIFGQDSFTVKNHRRILGATATLLILTALVFGSYSGKLLGDSEAVFRRVLMSEVAYEDLHVTFAKEDVSSAIFSLKMATYLLVVQGVLVLGAAGALMYCSHKIKDK